MARPHEFDYICDYYSVPAKKGARVRYTGDGATKDGTVTSTRGAGIYIRFDGEKESDGPYHPTWKMEWLDRAEAYE